MPYLVHSSVQTDLNLSLLSDSQWYLGMIQLVAYPAMELCINGDHVGMLMVVETEVTMEWYIFASLYLCKKPVTKTENIHLWQIRMVSILTSLSDESRSYRLNNMDVFTCQGK